MVPLGDVGHWTSAKGEVEACITNFLESNRDLNTSYVKRRLGKQYYHLDQLYVIKAIIKLLPAMYPKYSDWQFFPKIDPFLCGF